MRRVIYLSILSVFVGFAAEVNAEVVAFDNNWGRNPLFNVVSQSPTGVEIIFSMHEMAVDEAMIDGVPMKSFGVPSVFLPEEGVPNLTGACRYVAIPQDAKTTVTILDSRTEVYHDVEVAPAPNIPPESDVSPLRYEKDMSIYGRDAYYPSSPVRLSKPFKMRGVDVVLLGVIPFQYNPATKELIAYKDIQVRVDFVGGNGHFGEDRLRSRFWEPILQGHLLNYNSLPKIDFYAPERMKAPDGCEYIIIVPDDSIFEAWGDTIKAWRKLQGISSEVFTLTKVGGSTKEDIKNFLQNAYDVWNPRPVAFLLLSDYPSSGKVYGITSNVIPHPNPSRPDYASDNWYADFDDDTLPELHHGRICAQTEAHLGTMINKLLSYERNPYTAPNFYDEPLVACGWQSQRWFQLCIETVRGFFINSLGKTPARQYGIYWGTGYYPSPGCEWTSRQGSAPVVAYWNNLGYIPLTNPYDESWWSNGTPEAINAAINSGAFLVQHRDHGSETGWGEPDYHSSDLDGLTNTMFPFVNSTNCLTGRYHWEIGQCFTEKFHRITHGALGLNAASSVSYSFVNDTYIWGIFDALWPDFDTSYPSSDMTGLDNLRPCQAMTSGKYYLEASWMPDSVGAGSSGSYREITYGLFHHHGDAFTTLYSEMPQHLSVSHPGVLYVGIPSFPVAADDGSVIALTVDGEIIGVAEGTGGTVNVPIVAQSAPDTMVVTVTKFNHYRYAHEVEVIPPEGPYVIHDSFEIDDSLGNNNGVVNSGEPIAMSPTLRNVGIETASNVAATLSTADSFVTISDSVRFFGDIDSSDYGTSMEDYLFDVASNCPDEHLIVFNLTITADGDYEWNSLFMVEVFTPDIATSSDTLDFEGIYVDHSKSMLLTVFNLGSEVLNVTDIHLDNPDFEVDTASFSLGSGESQDVMVSFSPSHAGVYNDTLFITSNDPDEGIVSIELIGEGVFAPDISVYPDSLGANLLTGETETQILTIKNLGDNPSYLDFFFPQFGSEVSLRVTSVEGVHLSFQVIPIRRLSCAERSPIRKSGKDRRLLLGQGNGYALFGRLMPNLSSEDIVFFDDMESGVNGWTVQLYGGTTDDLWHQTNITYNSPVTSWWCEVEGQYNYNTGNQINTAVISPPIDLSIVSAPITLEFFEYYDTEPGWDFCMVDVSTDGGVTWAPLRGEYGAAPSGNSGGWIMSVLGLSDFKGEVIQIRFYFDTGDEEANDYPGWFLDDVLVTTAAITWLSVNPTEGTVESGESMDIEVTFDAAGLSGEDYNADIIIMSNDPDESEITVPTHLHVTEAPDIALSGFEYDSTSTIYWHSSGATTVHTFYVPSPALGDGTLTVTIDGDYNSNSEYADIYIEGDLIGTINPTVNGPTTESFTIPEIDLNDYLSDGTVAVTVANSPGVDPGYGNDFHLVQLRFPVTLGDTLDFGNVFIEDSTTLGFVVTNRGTDVLTVDDISSDNSDYTVDTTSFSLNPRESQEVLATFTPSTTGIITGILIITSNDPDEPIVTVSLQGEGAEPPDISVTPDSLSENLFTDDTSTQLLTIYNGGGSDLTFAISIEEAKAVAISIASTYGEGNDLAALRGITDQTSTGVDWLSVDSTSDHQLSKLIRLGSNYRMLTIWEANGIDESTYIRLLNETPDKKSQDQSLFQSFSG